MIVDCVQSACIQCCTDPTCEPHREARETLRKNQAILDGTDVITRMATKKRSSKVAKGAFKEPNIHYFGETVLLWNVREFMDNTKWRETAIRRSKRKLDSCDGIIERRNNKRGRTDNTQQNCTDETEASLASTKPKKSRKKRFEEVCKALLQNSLKE